MPTSNSRLAYEDCFDILNMAVDDENGARVKVSARKDAVSLRTRLHTARRIDREENAITYDKGHPLYGKSIYDALVVKIKELKKGVYIYIEKIRLDGQIEPLSSVPDLEEPAELEEPEAMKLLSPPEEVQVQHLSRRRV